jgi:hypothetical protein
MTHISSVRAGGCPKEKFVVYFRAIGKKKFFGRKPAGDRAQGVPVRTVSVSIGRRAEANGRHGLRSAGGLAEHRPKDDRRRPVRPNG